MYWILVNYFDVWGNESDGWEVNDQMIIDDNVYINDDSGPPMRSNLRSYGVLWRYACKICAYDGNRPKWGLYAFIWHDPAYTCRPRAQNRFKWLLLRDGIKCTLAAFPRLCGPRGAL